MTPSALPWWGWLLLSGTGLLLWFGSYLFATGEDVGCLAALFRWIMTIAAIICALIGLIRFVKWVWGS